MYIKNNKYYADAGHYLASGLTIGYELPIGMENIVEKEVTLWDMELRTSKAGTVNAHCTDGLISFGVKNGEDEADYAKLKTNIIKMRYTNDDQIAIMLNKDEGGEKLLDYERMQAWREWASQVAHKIMDLVNE